MYIFWGGGGVSSITHCCVSTNIFIVFPMNVLSNVYYISPFLQEKDQRSLDLNTAKCMLGLLLGKTWPLFPVFNQFLEVKKFKHTNSLLVLLLLLFSCCKSSKL